MCVSVSVCVSVCLCVSVCVCVCVCLTAMAAFYANVDVFFFQLLRKQTYACLLLAEADTQFCSPWVSLLCGTVQVFLN